MKKNDSQFFSGVFIIAEAGTSHGGDKEKAKDLIAAAAEAGADCVKFQAVFADEIIHPRTGKVPLPGGDVPLYEVFKRLERHTDFYAALKEETESKGCVFLCTPFGIKSAGMLKRLGVRMIKIASPELNHFPLLREVASYRLPVILSTGVSTLEDIASALSFFPRNETESDGSPFPSHPALFAPVILLHCITAYPAPEEEYNLQLIPKLSARFNVPVGLSDHSADPLLVPSAAAALGARAVEKHICLRHNEAGLDDPFALKPGQFEEMVREIRRYERLYSETGTEAGLKALRESCGCKRAERIIGDGVKRLAPSEAGNYARTNRSIHAVIDLSEGAVLSKKNIAVLRTEKVLTPGLHPKWFDTILGRRLERPVPAGEGIGWEDLA